MAREKRQVSENGVYRISLRGNDGEIFKKEEDYNEFKALLGRYFSDDKKVFGYSLTETSADMVVMVGEQSIGPAMKPLLTSYARYFNRTYNRSGKVFHDRYKSEPVASEQIEDVLKELDYADIAEALAEVSARTAELERKVRKKTREMDFWLL